MWLVEGGQHLVFGAMVHACTPDWTTLAYVVFGGYKEYCIEMAEPPEPHFSGFWPVPPVSRPRSGVWLTGRVITPANARSHSHRYSHSSTGVYSPSA